MRDHRRADGGARNQDGVTTGRSAPKDRSSVRSLTHRSPRQFRQSLAGSTRLETPGRLEELEGSSSGRTRGNAIVLEVPLARCGWRRVRYIDCRSGSPFSKWRGGVGSGRNPDGSSHIPARESCFVARESRLSFFRRR